MKKWRQRVALLAVAGTLVSQSPGSCGNSAKPVPVFELHGLS